MAGFMGKFKNILKDTELQAQQEANKLREKIIENAKFLVVFTGAGVSVESGIPPFTGVGGL